MTRSINPAGLALIEKSEGLRLAAYRDTGGVWTIGFGHTHNVKPGDTCSRTQAEQWLGEDIASAENAVEHLVTVPLTDNQFAALVDFAFNEGFSQFAKSTLLKRLNEGQHASVPTFLKAWVFDNGKRLAGLVTRRADEAALWSTE
jgi:lysozyme